MDPVTPDPANPVQLADPAKRRKQMFVIAMAIVVLIIIVVPVVLSSVLN